MTPQFHQHTRRYKSVTKVHNRDLPWPTIEAEVRSAVLRYMEHAHGKRTGFINLRYLVDWLYLNRYNGQYKHLTDRDTGWAATMFRCTRAMKNMGWVKFSANVYVVPVPMKPSETTD